MLFALALMETGILIISGEQLELVRPNAMKLIEDQLHGPKLKPDSLRHSREGSLIAQKFI